MRNTFPMLLLSFVFSACDSSGDTDRDATPDVSVDATPDVASDTAQDVASDTARDVASDTAQDVPRDVAQDVSPDVAADAPSDARTDVTEPFCDVPATYTFGPDGGLVPVVVTSRIEPGRRFTYTRTPSGRIDAGVASCTTTLDYCGTSDGGTVDTLAVINALNNADVMAAFADQVTTLYGTDPRPVDGQVFSITRGDGRHFEVGGDCGGSSGCRAIPAGLSRLRTVLNDLQTQQLARPECAAVRP
ncbi:MAG: hypothetical protein U0326_33505 [Polyangiales bacterium]